jgi:hypothetical protein
LMSKPTWKKTCGCSSTSAFRVWLLQQPRFRKDDFIAPGCNARIPVAESVAENPLPGSAPETV